MATLPDRPLSREEEYLDYIARNGGGGGGGGTTDYNMLNNLPKINGVEIKGDKTLDDLGAQEKLTSGTNIKTINGETLLGSGDITIQGGGDVVKTLTSADLNYPTTGTPNAVALWLLPVGFYQFTDTSLTVRVSNATDAKAGATYQVAKGTGNNPVNLLITETNASVYNTDGLALSNTQYIVQTNGTQQFAVLDTSAVDDLTSTRNNAPLSANQGRVLNEKIGDLTTLTTTEKTNTVAAINELDAGKADKATTLAGYGITDAYTKTEINGKLTGAFHYKGSVATVADLPATGNEVGDVYNVTENGDNYAWDGTAWDKLSGTVDLSSYYTKNETDALLDDKVDKVAGKGLSTNDYTDADKAIVDGITTALNGKQDTLTQGDGITIDATTNTISADFATDAEITAIVTQVFGGQP